MALKNGRPITNTNTILIGNVIPTGTVQAYSGGSVPSGWILCHGQELDRVVYASLFEVIGTIYGHGDGSTTFKLPDLRGQFIRGYDSGAGVDPGRMYGSYQADEVKSHNHGTQYIRVGAYNGTLAAGGGLSLQSLPSDNVGGSETRPKNVTMSYIIKA